MDIISAIEFDKSGDHLATGDRGGRVVLFERTDTKDVSLIFTLASFVLVKRNLTYVLTDFMFCTQYCNMYVYYMYAETCSMANLEGIQRGWTILSAGILSSVTKQSFRVMSLR